MSPFACGGFRLFEGASAETGGVVRDSTTPPAPIPAKALRRETFVCNGESGIVASKLIRRDGSRVGLVRLTHALPRGYMPRSLPVSSYSLRFGLCFRGSDQRRKLPCQANVVRHMFSLPFRRFGGHDRSRSASCSLELGRCNCCLEELAVSAFGVIARFSFWLPGMSPATRASGARLHEMGRREPV